MDVSKISPGKDVPNDINVVIEIPQGSGVKYEIDKDSGALVVDRILFTPMVYPAAYGFIPNTLAADGDPTDALVLMPAAVVPGVVVRARPIGVLRMEDESGQDEKIICVPHDKVHPYYSKVEKLEDLPEIVLKEIEHFFTRYKDLEKGKWVKVAGWADKKVAGEVILESVKAVAGK
ncbi:MULTISPECIES: inorganic diphosphatase [Komagataeibacter]|uniref:Inorganic pyrophosphatase n=2 Tax=Komagataeibacter TaxID=1434011 RepID=A0A0D6PY14_KOMEU|nr:MULTISPECIES: inorganic diphosphatase [Komagataeibacter]ARW17614.1 Inorganic diphosphatase [Komagataeibacter europaeus]MBE7730546.1 inorganic diphosphatase [Komagataeibacter sp. FXV3]GAN95923.1 inorganic pyrophosphatase [Komagataeibacter europaeus NBRC 3261]GCE84363.1 inorganic pyrophosphatase [Komagataeibacter diospyri]GCE91201.1 inorganic pyrophosphatase [Komagataeibacter diospyri]